jgi:uncharacterized protein (DUF427 family)
MSGFPPSITAINHIAPAPRRVRGLLHGATLFDTTRALYVWEWPHYPQYYLPASDVRTEFLQASGEPVATPQGGAQRYDIHIDGTARHAAARQILSSKLDALRGRYRFEWGKLDAWFEEDEEVFVHPRSPYTRVDAVRSRRTVRVELDGAVLAESPAPVMLYETGLPTRYYLDRGDVRFEHLTPSQTRTECPYKGRVTGYWSVAIEGKTYPDLAWSYAFPARQVLPIMGLVAFLNEKVDIFIDGVEQPRPHTHMGD